MGEAARGTEDERPPAAPECAALLIAGLDPDAHDRPRALAALIGDLDQTLRSTQARWAIRRLTPVGDERLAPTRLGIKGALDGVLRQGSDLIVVVIAGAVTGVAGAPALVTGANHRSFPDEATLALGWIGAQLRAAAGPRVVIVVSARPDATAPPPAAWLAALAADGTAPAVFVDAGGEGAAVAALTSGLRGAAVDAATGTVTLRSLADHLARAVPALEVRAERAATTLLRPASLDDLRALGWRRPAAAPAAPVGDLSCTVLRGEIRVDELLARGSFGDIYRARQLWMQRDVAIKVLPVGVDARSDDGALFLDEIRAIARIDHPNVVRVLHADETFDGRLFFAMELLTGEDLDQLADRGPVPAARAIALMGQLLAGLAAAHAHGLIHADIKPGNVFVAGAGPGERVVLLDFGLARFARAGEAARSAGGTPQYMAPEHYLQRRVDERSDLFAVGLVLFTLLTGWRRESERELVPPLGLVADDRLRAILGRALAADPSARFADAAQFAAALAAHAAGTEAVERPAPSSAPSADLTDDDGGAGPAQPPPFRRLHAFSQRDRDRFFGRDREIAHLLDHVLQHPAVVYTAPSGVGKTSLLRAGLLPRLEALGGRGSYVACGPSGGLADRLAEAAAALAQGAPARQVLIVDQVEAALVGDEDAVAALLRAAVARAAAAPDGDHAVVLAVREDFLGRLLDRLELDGAALPILRLPPLDPDGARAAFVRPLAARHLAVDDALLGRLLADLAAAAAGLGAEMGWSRAPAIYPPHLQLAGARLHEALPADASTLTLIDYQRVGGLDEIVRSHLGHVLASELTADQAPVARELFKHLITPAATRASPTEVELTAAVPGPATLAVLEALRRHGLVARFARGHGDARWELIHDSLIPRIQAWMDDGDVERRRALELLRHHARQSRPGAPSLLSASELRALRRTPEVIDIVEREWTQRGAQAAWLPTALVARSSAQVRRRQLATGSAAVLGLAAATAIATSWWIGRRDEQRRRAQIMANQGRFELELAPFDWDPVTHTARPVPASELPRLTWTLHEVAADPDQPGDPMGAVRSQLLGGGPVRRERVEAPGRAAFLIVDGRGRDGEICAPSIVPIRALPGYYQRDQVTRRIAVPTCQASRADTIEIAAGPFLAGGDGEPPYPAGPYVDFPRRQVELPRFRLDRTEVTNVAFARFGSLADVTGLPAPVYPDTPFLANADGDLYPVGGLPWVQARAYCRFLGKDLPTSDQWEKALRGNLTLAGGVPNPHPVRNVPWDPGRTDAVAKLEGVGPPGPEPVGSYPDDTSVDGVVDLAGNQLEWSRDVPINGDTAFRVARGGYWEEGTPDEILAYVPVPNWRRLNVVSYSLGFRCAIDDP